MLLNTLESGLFNFQLSLHHWIVIHKVVYLDTRPHNGNILLQYYYTHYAAGSAYLVSVHPSYCLSI